MDDGGHHAVGVLDRAGGIPGYISDMPGGGHKLGHKITEVRGSRKDVLVYDLCFYLSVILSKSSLSSPHYQTLLPSIYPDTPISLHRSRGTVSLEQYQDRVASCEGHLPSP
jgi:hypothetical protein